MRASGPLVSNVMLSIHLASGKEISINLACHISGIDFFRHLVNRFVTKLPLLERFPKNIGNNYLLCTFGVIKNIFLFFPASSLFCSPWFLYVLI